MGAKNLFEPLKIRNLTIENRIVVPPMVTFGWSDDTGVVKQEHIDHYGAIAAGGPGLVIMEATCVTKEGRLSANQLGIWDDSQIDGLKKITDAVHSQGKPIFIQIHHAGVVGINENPLCPDEYTTNTSVTGKKMTLEEIDAIKDAFIQAGRRAYEAGFDGVELHGCHRYLFCQFLNARINKRDDIYGQDPEKIIIDVMAGIRSLVPDDFVIGIRLGAFEPTLKDGLRHGKILEEHGIDFLNISYGFAGEHEPFAPEGYPVKDVIYAAEEFKKHCNVPIFAVNGIRTPAEAQKVLEVTDVDMINIGRSFLTDYNWANKAKNNEMPVVCFHCKSCQWRGTPEKCPGRIKAMKAMNA